MHIDQKYAPEKQIVIDLIFPTDSKAVSDCTQM